MTRFVTFALAIPLLLTDACNVTENENGSSTISLDENRIEQGAELVANEASEAREKAANALENAGPIIENSASDIERRAGRVADKVEMSTSTSTSTPPTTSPGRNRLDPPRRFDRGGASGQPGSGAAW